MPGLCLKICSFTDIIRQIHMFTLPLVTSQPRYSNWNSGWNTACFKAPYKSFHPDSSSSSPAAQSAVHLGRLNTKMRLENCASFSKRIISHLQNEHCEAKQSCHSVPSCFWSLLTQDPGDGSATGTQTPQLEFKLQNLEMICAYLKSYLCNWSHHHISWRPSASMAMGSRQSRKAPPQPDGCATKAALVPLFFPTWQKRQRQRKTTPHVVDPIDTCAGSAAHNGRNQWASG